MSTPIEAQEDDEPDAERIEVEPDELGPPINPPELPVTFATVVARNEDRRPIIPAVLRSREERRQLVRWSVRFAGYVLAFHSVRSPIYLGRILWWTPRGVGRLTVGAWRWAYAMEQWGLRQQAATRDDDQAYLRLQAQADRHRRFRVPVLFTALGLLLVAGLLMAFLAPWWAQAVTLTGCLIILARTGRPAGQPILDRVTHGKPFRILTDVMVRAAMIAINIGVKTPESLTFQFPIHRTGPGFLARVNLPPGLEAVKAIEKRNALSSALRLPVDQVWPSVGPDHAGQVDLWVGYEPASKMKRARWALVSGKATTSAFGPIPFGVDPQMRPVYTTMFQRNFLIGGQPGSGKTFAGRALVIGGLLDPTAEVWLAAFKPAEDFHDLSEFCTRYTCGVDEVAFAEGQQMVADGLQEVRRRQTLLGKLKREGKIAEGRTDPQLAAAGIGLHPLILVFDEVHELFLASKEAVEDMIRLIKQGRSAGVIVVLITQVADKDSVPPNVTRCVSSRWCLSVLDQVANDQIMGTGAYKRGQTGTVYRPRVDAGWGASAGMSDEHTGPVRAYYPDEEDLRRLIERIRAVRSGGSFRTSSDPAPTRDVLADVLRVFAYVNRPSLQWKTLAELLAEQQPEAYPGATAEVVSALVRNEGVASRDVKAGGEVLKGCYRSDVQQVVERRELGSGSGQPSLQDADSAVSGGVS